MPKNFYNPADIRRMTRSQNKADRDRLRVLEQQDKRRRKEQEKVEASMEWENPLSVEQELEKIMEQWGKEQKKNIYGKSWSELKMDDIRTVTTTVNEGEPVYIQADELVAPTEPFQPVPKPPADEWKLIEL